MQSPYQPISDEDRAVLDKLGMKPYTGHRIPNICNPASNEYWISNGLIFVTAVLMRLRLLKIKGPHGMMSLPILAIPIFTIFDRSKLDSLYNNGYNSHSFEDRLEFSPLTKRAWLSALEENERYQEKLRIKISELEKRGDDSNDSLQDDDEEE